MSAGIELTADALVDKLSSGMAAKCDALNTEYNDGRTLDHPAAVVLGPRSDTPAYPFLMVVPGAEPITDDRGSMVTYAHDIDVYCDVVDQDEENLTRKTLRYARAIREVVLANRRPGAAGAAAGYGLAYLRTDYSLLFTPEQPEWRVCQRVRVQFRVLAEQLIG